MPSLGGCVLLAQDDLPHEVVWGRGGQPRAGELAQRVEVDIVDELVQQLANDL